MQDKNKGQAMCKLVEQWQQSGISQRLFCEKNRIKLSTFGYWVKKLHRRQTPDPGFASLTLRPEPVMESSVARIEIELPGGLVVRIY